MRQRLPSRSWRLAAGLLLAVLGTSVLPGCTVVERDRYVERGPFWVPGHWVPRGGYWHRGYWR